MSQNNAQANTRLKPWSVRVFGWLLFFLTVTGFGQMPIFKRYYVADIPGLAWLAEFYVTHFLHYLGGTLILALIGYVVSDWVLQQSRKTYMTAWGWSRVILLASILGTGLLLALKNYTGYWYSPTTIVVLDLTHLGLVMAWLTTGLVNLFLKKRWVVTR